MTDPRREEVALQPRRRGRRDMDLTACVFDGVDGAELAAHRIESVADTSADCGSWAVVRWDRDDRLPRSDVPLPADLRSARTAWFWSLLLGVTFSVPALGARLGIATGLDPGILAGAGIHDSFMNRLRDEVVPGRSALLVLSGQAEAQALDALIHQRDIPVVAQVHFTPRQEAALLDVLS